MYLDIIIPTLVIYNDSFSVVSPIFRLSSKCIYYSHLFKTFKATKIYKSDHKHKLLCYPCYVCIFVYQCYHTVVLTVMCNSSALSGINYLVIYLKQIVLADLGNKVAK